MLSVDTSDFDKHLVGYFTKLPEILSSEARKAVKEVGNRVIREARATHRYKVRTGRLERSTEMRTIRNGIMLWINPMQAKAKSGVNYGRLVHQGWTRTKTIVPVNKKSLRWTSGTSFVYAKKVVQPAQWQPDPFLFNAWDKLEPFFKLRMARALAVSSKRAWNG